MDRAGAGGRRTTARGLTGRAPAAVGLALLLAAAGCSTRSCGGLGGDPPSPLPIVKRAEGNLRLLDKGQWKGYYDADGRLVVVEYDSDKDGRADYIAHNDEQRRIRLIEVDEDHDGWVDRWEHYGPDGVLEKVGRSRHRKGYEDEWTYRGADGLPARIEYDDGHTGHWERAEILKNGVVVRVEIDSDGDGRPDRWQSFERGRLTGEELDTDHDGTADRRLVFDNRGRLQRLERPPR